MSAQADTLPPPAKEADAELTPEERAKFQKIQESIGEAAVGGVAAEQAHDKAAVSGDAQVLKDALGVSPQEANEGDAPLLDQPTDMMDDKPLTMAILGRDDDADRAARAKATKRLEHELNEGGFAKRLVNRVWKGNIRKEAYRQRYIREAKSEIQKQQDVLWYAEYNDELRNQAADSILERFRRGRHYTDAHVGETYKELGEGSVVGDAMRELINIASKKATASEWTDDKVQEKYDEIIAADQARGEDSEIKGGQQVTTTDLLKVIESLRGRDMHDEALDHAVSTMRIVAGETRSGARTEANYSLSDKIIKTLGEKKWLGGLVNEATVSVALTTAFTALNLGRGFMQRAVGLGTPGVMGAAFGAARAHKQAKDDIAMTRAEHELGEIFGANDKYRDKLDKMVYPSKSAAELTAELIASVDKKTLDEGGETALEVALKMLAEAEVRRKFTNAEYKDVDKPIALISYTSAVAQESEKLALREAELLARNKLAGQVSRLDDATSERLGVSIDMADVTRPDGTKTQIPQLNLQQRYEVPIKQQFEAQIAESDAMARRYVLGKTAVGAAIGGAVSFGTSFALQEAAHAIADSHASPKLNLNVNNGNSGNLVPQGNAANHLSVNGSNTIAENTADHTFTIKDTEGNSIVDGLKQNPNGTFDQPSLDKLNSAGVHVETIHHDAVYETKTTSVDQFVTDHKGEFQQLKMSYMDNNTAAFDLNEQGGRLSYNPDGTVAIGQNMTANGSFGNGVQLDMTKTQNNVLDISFKQSDGTFLHKTFNYGQPIPKPWADMLYQKNDGTWGFRGNGEVHWGKVHDGTFYAAASIPGENKSFDLTSQVLKTPEYFENKLTVPSVDSESGGFTPVVVGTIGRQGVADRKSAKEEEPAPPPPPKPEKTPSPDMYAGYGAAPEEWRQQMIADRIPELRRDPNARISLQEGLQWHHDLTRRKDPEYADYIERLVGTMPNLASLDANTDTIVPILVGANFEHDNIYRTLSLYAQMPDDWKAKSQLVLHVNWIDSKENDPIEKAKIDKTRSEVLRAIQDFPELNISQFESIWSQEKLDKGEYGDRLIAHAAQQLVDVSMAAAYQGMQDGRIPEDHDILLWKGDADAQGMGRFAGPRMTKEFKDHPEADAFSGGVRWGTEIHKELPGLGFVLNFMEVYRIAAQRAHIKSFQSTFGVNGGARMSTFAGIGGIGHYTNQKQSPPDDGWGDRMFAARNPSFNGTAEGIYGASDGRTKANNNYHRHVGGASIDTDASRFEKVYRNNEPITSIWGNVNSNGYQGRTTGLQAGQNSDDVRNRSDEVIDRIEYQMSDLISHWTIEPAQVATALAIMLPGPGNLGGKLAYTIKKDAAGESKFSLTPQGKKWLISRLQFNSKGQYDPYGDRQARQLYGKTVMRGSAGRRWSIPVKQSLSRMVAGKV